MSKDMMRRLAAIEAANVELPPELRQWLGEPITDAERAAIVPAPPLSDAEWEAALHKMPPDLRAWLEERNYRGSPQGASQCL